MRNFTPGSYRAQPTRAEDDATLVFAQHGDAHPGEDSWGDGDEQSYQQPGGRREFFGSLLRMPVPQRVEYLSIAAATESSCAVRAEGGRRVGRGGEQVFEQRRGQRSEPDEGGAQNQQVRHGVGRSGLADDQHASQPGDHAGDSAMEAAGLRGVGATGRPPG